uniref:52 kDa repressor of the inhibitor of the protein kinase n=1 Tax=Cacopsylla melanoneura TaxID=428564 RepID=A0A8D8ZFX7_9HEMI
MRRQYVPNMPTLCETRWSHKYKSIRIFHKNIPTIYEALENLSKEGNTSTRKSAFQLQSAMQRPVFLVCATIIGKYSNILEPVANILQSKSLDLLNCTDHVNTISSLIKEHRENVDDTAKGIMFEVNEIADQLNITIAAPRTSKTQTHRTNTPANSTDEYFKRSIIIPYLDSLIMSLGLRFSETNLPAYSILQLHPYHMLQISSQQMKSRVQTISAFYEIEGLEYEIELWRKLWVDKGLTYDVLKDIDLIDCYKECSAYFPSVKTCLAISLAQPCTTSSVERSFSTLRRVKTWLRATMATERLSGLCLLSIHRKMAHDRKEELQMKVLEKFAEDKRRIVLL